MIIMRALKYIVLFLLIFIIGVSTTSPVSADFCDINDEGQELPIACQT